MKKGIFKRKKNFINISIVTTVLLIFFTLISNNTLSLIITNQVDKENIISVEFKEETSNGLARRNNDNVDKLSKNNLDKQPFPIIQNCDTMYGYNAYDPSGQHPEGTIFFDTCDPKTIEELGDTISDYFLTGGTFGCDGIWYGVQYGNGLLYGIDPYSGDMWSIGGGGTSLNTLAYDPIYNRMYGVSSNDNLWEVDPDTGEQDLIGSLGYSGGEMIGMAFNRHGELYGWDLVSDKLWKIDFECPEIEEVGPLGIDLNYAQDGDFHRAPGEEVLYLTAYTNTGALYICDIDTGQCEFVDNFEGGMEITASIFLNCCMCPESDVGVESINFPDSGYAIEEIPMQVSVKNHGNNTEITDVQMQVTKYEAGSVIMEEDFSGNFPPDGWETDYWNKSDTNNSGGTAPEAIVYKYDQYNGGQYYDNYIMTGQIDCTGLEKVTLRFRWAGDYDYPQYPSVYVKFRRNSTSPWKDFTPWDNPINSNQYPQLWETSCYSFDEPFGDEFQVKWQYLGYYGYYNSLWLDDIEIIEYVGLEEYNEIFEDLEIKIGEVVIVDFPNWTPSDWQNPDYENVWQDYRVKACTLFWDDNPNNDCKDKLIDLYFPWFHDVEVKSIDSPCEDGPGKTYPVKATIKNVGQYAECCIPIDIQIGNSFIVSQPLYETDWPGDTNPNGTSYRTYFPGYDNGWRDEHKVFAYYYGWRQYNGAYSGGEAPEAYAYYYYMRQDYHFYSAPLDVSGVDTLTLKFKWYINHYSGQGLYSLEAGYSYDLVTWYASFHEEPSSTGGPYEVEVPIQPEQDTMYIGLWVKGDPYYFNYWYVDDVELVVMGQIEEYSDFAYQSSNIEPGEEITIEFDDWIPEFLQYETTGTKEYIIETSIEMDGDKNTNNDFKKDIFTLYFWHDVGIEAITSPTGEGHPRKVREILWDNGEPDGEHALPSCMYLGYSNIFIDDFQVEYNWLINGGIINIVWNNGYGSGNTELIRVYLYKDEGDCDPSLIEYPEEGFYIEANTFEETTTGNYYFGRPEIIIDFELDEEISVPTGKWYIGIQLDGINEDLAYILSAPDKGCMSMGDLPYFGYPRWSSSQYLYGTTYDLSFKIEGTKKGPPTTNAWIQPSKQDIDSIVKNYGTFPKEDLTCYAEIREYITDPENGKQVYSDEIYNIDLDPLGDEQNLQFNDFTFEDEGRYGLFIDLPTELDDEQKNNKMTWGVAVDGTSPESDFPPILDPPDPDGLNGWYVSPISVFLKAIDPWSNGVSSGVKEFRYTLNGGSEQVCNNGFLIFEDGEWLIKYWAVDWVGNIETPENEFSVKIDSSIPETLLDYEVTGGSKFTGWEFTFTATATDEMSGVDYVEFYLNGLIQKTVEGSGPEYKWTVKLPEGIKTVIKAIAYDNAGLFSSDEIEDPEISSKNVIKNNNYQYSIYIILREFLDSFPFIQRLLDILEDFY